MTLSKKFRPRFTLRTLAVTVTLVCVYFGSWEATKRYGVHERWTSNTIPNREVSTVIESSSPAPFLVTQTESVRHLIDADYLTRHVKEWRKRTYFWFFGMRIRLSDSGRSMEEIRKYAKLPMPYARD